MKRCVLDWPSWRLLRPDWRAGWWLYRVPQWPGLSPRLCTGSSETMAGSGPRWWVEIPGKYKGHCQHTVGRLPADRLLSTRCGQAIYRQATVNTWAGHLQTGYCQHTLWAGHLQTGYCQHTLWAGHLQTGYRQHTLWAVHLQTGYCQHTLWASHLQTGYCQHTWTSHLQTGYCQHVGRPSTDRLLSTHVVGRPSTDRLQSTYVVGRPSTDRLLSTHVGRPATDSQQTFTVDSVFSIYVKKNWHVTKLCITYPKTMVVNGPANPQHCNYAHDLGFS